MESLRQAIHPRYIRFGLAVAFAFVFLFLPWYSVLTPETSAEFPPEQFSGLDLLRLALESPADGLHVWLLAGASVVALLAAVYGLVRLDFGPYARLTVLIAGVLGLGHHGWFLLRAVSAQPGVDPLIRLPFEPAAGFWIGLILIAGMILQFYLFRSDGPIEDEKLPPPLRFAARLLRDERVIKAVLQVVFVVLMFIALITLAQNVSSALARNNLSPNFAFWNNRAGFNIGGAEDYYSPNDSYGRAFIVGLENTIRVVIIGLPLATIVGIIFGVALLSTNFLIKTIARVYVEILRNTPLLVQLFAMYFIVVLSLPVVRNAIEIPAGNPLIALSNRGIVFPEILTTPRLLIFAVISLVGLVIGYAAFRELSAFSERAGRDTRAGLVSVGVVILVAVIGYIAAALPPAPATVEVVRDGQAVEVAVSEALEQNLLTREQRAEVTPAPLLIIPPQRQGLRYAFGSIYSSEYIALLLGLVIYTSAFIAEIVRAGIQAVDKGQVEAARALGFSYVKTLRLIILPQALRVIIPPLGNQYLNLAKNSSLAIAISFADLFMVSNTIINQTGQTVSVFALVMLSYLVMSLLISYVMNSVNSRFQLVTRVQSGSRSPMRQVTGWLRRAPARR